MANHDYAFTTDGKPIVPDLCMELVSPVPWVDPEPCLIEQPCPKHPPAPQSRPAPQTPGGAQHSPLPWHQNEKPWLIYDKHGFNVTQVEVPYGGDRIARFNVATANAALIVEAVNSLAALRAQANAAQEALARIAAMRVPKTLSVISLSEWAIEAQTIAQDALDAAAGTPAGADQAGATGGAGK